MTGEKFVPDGFAPPRALASAEFHLVPLGPEHNESDHAAWTASVAHIRATPGFEAHPWPPEDGMPLAENLADLEQHARDFEERTGFTYTVLAPGTEEVIGCVYIYPARDDEHDAHVRTWVRADRGELDPVLHAAVSRWLAERWPFERPRYAPRTG
jgi:RimJ/RimL family protein N-acetyltransferase